MSKTHENSSYRVNNKSIVDISCKIINNKQTAVVLEVG